MPLDIVTGAQWGDEGKGRIVDLLSAEAAYVARFSGGDNAGHTVTVGDAVYKLHLVPSGIVHPGTCALIGNGVVINPRTLLQEIEQLRASGIEIHPERLRISYAAHLITPGHLALDRAQEQARGKAVIGTTLRGIGPAYVSKTGRFGLRLGAMADLESFADQVRQHIERVNRELTAIYRAEPLDAHQVAREYAEYSRLLQPYIDNVSLRLHRALAAGERVLAEGAQGTLLDLDHGTYPYVTSSTPVAPGALTGLGLGLGTVGRVIGVTKAFQTRVGEGPFPTEVSGELAAQMRGSGENPWDEYGTTTGRPRRVGWLDLVLLRYAVRVNGFSEIALTKLDVLSGLQNLQICTTYRDVHGLHDELPMGPDNLTGFSPVYQQLPGWNENLWGVHRWRQLPEAARNYVERVQRGIGLPVRIISVGPERDQVICL